MADENIKQVMQDAILDADSLERFINGSENETVLTRLSAEYPTLQNAISQVNGKLDSAETQIKQSIVTLFENGGLPATPFKTKAEMEASGLPDGSYAVVTEDDDNNGLYIKDGGAFSESSYSEYKRAVNEALEKVSLMIEHSDDDDNLVELKDSSGNLYGYISQDGDLFLTKLEGSVQSEVLETKHKLSLVAEIDASSPNLFEFKDSEGVISSFLSGDNTLYVNDVVTEQGSVSSFIKSEVDKEEVESKLLDVSGEVYYHADLLRSDDVEPEIKEFVFFNISEFEGYVATFAPSIDRISDNEYYASITVFGATSDYGDNYVVGRKVTYNKETDDFTLGEIQTLAMHGLTSEGVRYSYMNSNVTHVKNGTNAGRIIVHFNYMTNPSAGQPARVYKPYMVYSDNGGETFTAPTDLSGFFPIDEWKGLNFGPGHGIQLRLGENKNRILIPAYTRTTPYMAVCAYSDDGGDTFYYSNLLTNPPLLNEWQVGEMPDGRVVGLLRMDSNRRERYISYSYDGGTTFSKPELCKDIEGAGSKTGFAQITNPYDTSVQKLVACVGRVIDSNGVVNPTQDGRKNAHIFVSYDGGKTFPIMKQIGTDRCEYSDVTSIDKNNVLVIYGGGTGRGTKVVAKKINLAFLMEK